MEGETAAPSYVVRAESLLAWRRELSFPNLSAARYFARTWANKSHTPILVVDCRSGLPLERYSLPKSPEAIASAAGPSNHDG
jgi:hypothetical protein